MSQPGKGYEAAGRVIPEDFAALVEWSRNNAPSQDSAAGAAWSQWQPTPVRIGDIPYPMLRVGVTEGLSPESPPLVMMGGLGAGHTALVISKEKSSADTAVDVVIGTLLRTIGMTMPGTVCLMAYSDGKVSGINPDRKATLKDFGELSSAKSGTGSQLLEHVYSNTLEGALAGIWQFQEKLNSGEVDKAGTLDNPWRIMIMLGDTDLTDKGRDYLNRLIHAGVDWGMFLGVGVRGLVSSPLLQDGPPRPIPYLLDPPPPKALVRKTVAQVAEAAKQGPGRVPPAHEYYAHNEDEPTTVNGIEADVGLGLDGSRIAIRFDNTTPHGLLEGASGEGKTTFLRSMICSLARYSPDELSLVIIDGKYAGMAIFGRSDDIDGSGEVDAAFLPQATRLGLNITDPEDALAILRELNAELDRRKTLMGDLVAGGDFGKLRAGVARRDGQTLPRILLVIDEIQEFIGNEIGEEFIKISNRLATMGRELGMHMLFATVQMENMSSGADSLSVKQSGLLGGFLLRVATRSAASVLDPIAHKNFMPLIPQHAVAVNTNGGKYTTGNKIARVPNASIDSVRFVKTAAWRRWGDESRLPVVLDGRAVPNIEDSSLYRDLKPSTEQWPVGFVGQEPGASADAANFQFNRAPGRNVAVMGSEPREIAQVFQSLAATIPKQYKPGQVKFTVLCRSPELVASADKAAAQLRESGHAVNVVADRAAQSALDDIARNITLSTGSDEEQDHYLLVYGANGLRSDSFETILKEGPERGTHVVASWATLARLKGSMGGYGDPADVAEGYVLLNVTTDEVREIAGSHKYSWGKSARPGRAFFGDARSGEPPRMVKLYS